jgi:phage shock protein PspC (stress-responsive transcriptional regulator)
MNCKLHPDREATASCVGCGELVCADCDVLVGGRHFCRRCLAGAADVDVPRAEPRGAGARSGPARRLTRSRTDRWISGVCGGLAVHADMDPTLVRLLAIVLLFATGLFPGVIGYLVAACVIPEEDAT